MNHELISQSGKYCKHLNLISSEILRRAKPFSNYLLESTDENIAKEVSLYYNLPIEIWTSKSRQHTKVKCRQTFFWLCRKLTRDSHYTIGHKFGMSFDHSTIVNACNVINNMIETRDEIGKGAMKILSKFEQ